MQHMNGSELLELSAAETHDVRAGSLLGYCVGYVVGAVAGIIANADPFNGHYYGVGA